MVTSHIWDRVRAPVNVLRVTLPGSRSCDFCKSYSKNEVRRKYLSVTHGSCVGTAPTVCMQRHKPETEAQTGQEREGKTTLLTFPTENTPQKMSMKAGQHFSRGKGSK